MFKSMCGPAVICTIALLGTFIGYALTRNTEIFVIGNSAITAYFAYKKNDTD